MLHEESQQADHTSKDRKIKDATIFVGTCLSSQQALDKDEEIYQALCLFRTYTKSLNVKALHIKVIKDKGLANSYTALA